VHALIGVPVIMITNARAVRITRSATGNRRRGRAWILRPSQLPVERCTC